MAHDPNDVWADMTIKVWPERYWLVDLDSTHTPAALAAMTASTGRYCCTIRDQTGFSFALDDETWRSIEPNVVARQKFGPLKVISTDSPLPFDVVGFIQAALRKVNGAGHKAAPQCGAAADHFFTGEQDIETVESLFNQLIAEAKAKR